VSVDEIERLAELPSTFEQARPFKIKVMVTMNGLVFGAKCRCCNLYFGYFADLDNAFESVELHLARHKYEQEVVDFQEQTC
jgi:hypothetical protein